MIVQNSRKLKLNCYILWASIKRKQVFFFLYFYRPFCSPYILLKEDDDVYLQGVDRREQGKLSLVVTFSCRIRFCEARSTTRSDTAAFLRLPFSHFLHGKTILRKMNSFTKVTNQLVKEQELGCMFSSLLLQCSCCLEKTTMEGRIF